MHAHKTNSPVQVRAQALENATSYLGLSIALSLTRVTLILPRLKGILTP